MGSLTLVDGKTQITDIITTADDRPLGSSAKLSHVAYINRHKVPLYLVSKGPFDVYTSNKDTEAYFAHMLAMPSSVNPSLAQLARVAESPCYYVFYCVGNGLRCFEVDLDIPARVEALKGSVCMDRLSSVYFSSLAPRSDTAVFDRVLQNKSKRNTYLAPRAPARTPLSVSVLSGDQISHAVNKLTLSGLRLRGLNPNALASSHQRTVVRELYQMTKKLAFFALRKFNYSFNGSRDCHIRLQDVQDVVERLLQAYVDVDDQMAPL